jgi:hypothetical protein
LAGSLRNGEDPPGLKCTPMTDNLLKVRPSILSFQSPQDLAHPRTRRNVPGASRRSVQPLAERTEFHRALDRRISCQDANREVLADILDPTALADRPEPQRDRFIEAFGGDFSVPTVALLTSIASNQPAN